MTTNDEDIQPLFFATAEEFRAWLSEHHADRDEVWVGFYKVGSGRPTMTYAQAVDELLCFGWIDSVRRRIDEVSYMNRFTPRKPRSNWSAINIARVTELTREGRMHPAGLAAFEKRDEGRSRQRPSPPG